MVDRSLPETRKFQGGKQTGPRGYLAHLPVRVCGLPGEAPPLELVLASTHLALFKDGQMDRTDKQVGVRGRVGVGVRVGLGLGLG